MKSTSNRINKDHIKTVTAVGLFSALAYVCCVLFHFKAGFLSFDLKDAVMAVGAMIFGPIYGVAMAIIVAIIESLTISTTEFYGFIMNVLSSCTFVGVAGLIYSRHRTIKLAVVGITAASLTTVAVMMLANYLITPLYMQVSRSDVVSLIPTLLLPFNLTKTVFNSAVVFIIYKPIVTAMRTSGFLVSNDGVNSVKKNGKLSLTVSVIAISIAAAALIFFFVKLGGSFSVGK